MKRAELILTALLVPMDLVMIILAFVAAYHLRLNTGEVEFYWPIDQYLAFVATLAPLWLAVFALADLYTLTRIRRQWEELGSVFVGVSGGTFLVIAWPFLTRQEFFSRLVVIYIFVLAVLFVIIGRTIIRTIRHALYRRGIGVHHLAIVGTNGGTAELVDAVVTNPNLGMKLIGLIKSHSDDPINPSLKDTPILGTIGDLAAIRQKHPFDDLLLADSSLSRKETFKLLEFAEERGVSFKVSPGLLEVHSSNIGVSQVGGVPILEYRRTPLEGWGKILKRIVDLLGAVVGIILFSPFMLLTALAVKLTSPGAVIYKNERVGDNGRFYAYKFRSMKIEYCVGDAYGGNKALQVEADLIKKQNTRKGPLYKIGADPRLTPIGEFIRKTSLDELPQFFNVLRGEMSLVGPRPHQPREVEKYERHHLKLLHIKPGITGLAQISGRSDLEFEDEFRLDTYYIENWSLWLDLQIIFKTPFILLASRGRKAA